MTSIEKSTMKLTTVIVVITAAIQFTTAYFGSNAGTRDAINDIKLEVNDLKNKDQLIMKDVATLQNDMNKLESITDKRIDAITSFIGTGMRPEEPTFKRYRR